ncbi:MAG: DUF3343 domain-containing protein [Clostridia bacterium]|nr:DUF3343 domain-containing protein [Clostridia bacterium]
MQTKRNTGGVSVAAIGAMTAAIRAQRALLSAGISAEVIALLPSQTRKGCAYGVEYSALDDSAARAALQQARIRVSQYLRKETP